MIDNSKKYNIGIIANATADEGKNVYLAKTIEIFKPLTNEIFVIDGDFPEVPDRRIHIIKIKADEKKELMLIRSIKFLLEQLRFCYNLIEISKRIDLVISFSATAILPLLSAKLMRKKIIIIVGGSASKSADKIYREILKNLEKIGYNLSDRMAVESESTVNFLKLDRYKQKIFIISNTYIDTDLFKIKKDLKNRNLIGFISRLNEGKGIMNFVKAIPLILKEKNDLEFLIGGDGSLFNEIKQELKNNRLYDKVKLTGWIPHDKLPNYLNELKLIVLPTYMDAAPTIVSESMACGTPVLATSVGGIPDLIKNGETGFILEDNSPECIAKNVIRTLEHPNIDEIAKKARIFIEEEYTYEAAVEKYRKILDNLEVENHG